jgi:ABC-type Fe3+/spermidine/putrescine transport system ATPase subunit
MSISVKNLVKIYGTNKVVDGVAFEVAKGEFVSLLGPSGCGKTTTLRCIAGLEEANGGEISITGEVVSAPERDVMSPPNARDVGMVFQSYAVWPHMTVAENVAFPLRIRKGGAKEIEDRVDWALGIVGLKALRDRQPSQLSGGQQQRVALARAIVGRPRVLLFDEPLSNLDAKLRDTTRAEIRRLQKELNIAALYVTHDQAEALSMSDRVIVMDKGVIQQAGSPKELYRRPINKFVADFVGVASFIDVTRADHSDAWRLPDGTVVKADSAAAQPGKQHQLMLRPEAVGLAPAGTAFPGDGVQALKGRIAEVSYLGAYSEYLIEAGGALVRVHANEDLAPGTDVAMAFRTVDARIVLT